MCIQVANHRPAQERRQKKSGEGRVRANREARRERHGIGGATPQFVHSGGKRSSSMRTPANEKRRRKDRSEQEPGASATASRVRSAEMPRGRITNQRKKKAIKFCGRLAPYVSYHRPGRNSARMESGERRVTANRRPERAPPRRGRSAIGVLYFVSILD